MGMEFSGEGGIFLTFMGRGALKFLRYCFRGAMKNLRNFRKEGIGLQHRSCDACNRLDRNIVTQNFKFH